MYHENRSRHHYRPKVCSPFLLGNATALQHFVSTLLVRKYLLERELDASARLHPAGILVLKKLSDGTVSRGFVVATASSMEPRPIWPMFVPMSVLELVPVDWVVGCSVPKTPALENLHAQQPAEAYILGWLSAAQVTRLPIVTVEPHLGHEFQAQYHQAKNRQLLTIDDFPR